MTRGFRLLLALPLLALALGCEDETKPKVQSRETVGKTELNPPRPSDAVTRLMGSGTQRPSAMNLYSMSPEPRPLTSVVQPPSVRRSGAPGALQSQKLPVTCTELASAPLK